jgi:hypothetical protein
MRALVIAFLSVCTLANASTSWPGIRRQDSASTIGRQTSGSFRFVDSGTKHPITVWFCRTPRITPDTRIVFVMHGSESETARQACCIAGPYVQSHNAIVLAPQFRDPGSMAQGKTTIRQRSAVLCHGARRSLGH